MQYPSLKNATEIKKPSPKQQSTKKFVQATPSASSGVSRSSASLSSDSEF